MADQDAQITVTENVDLASILFSRDSKDRISKIEGMLQKKVGKKMKFLLDKALELADGIYMVQDNDPLKIKYYKKAPDLNAIIYLCDRLLGKPVAKSEVKDETGKKGIQSVQNIIINLAGNKNGKPNGPKPIAGSVVNVRPSENTVQK